MAASVRDSGQALHGDFDALLRAQPGSCSSLEYVRSGSSAGGILVTRAVPDARSNSSDTVQQWWSVSTGSPDWSEATLSPSPAGRVIEGHIYSRISPSGRFVAVFRKISAKGAGTKESRVLEIRSLAGAVVARTELGKAHGDVLSPSWFGGACWSADERCLFYTAEAKRAEPKHFWESADAVKAATPDTNHPSEKSKPCQEPTGNVNDYVDDWGEQNTGTVQPQVFRIEPWTGASPQQIPVDAGLAGRLGWGQPQVSPDNRWLIVTAWAVFPRRLGSIYCMQRPSGIYAIDLSAWQPGQPSDSDSSEACPTNACPTVLLSSGEVQARSARLSPDGSKLVFLGRDGHASPGDGAAAAKPGTPGILRTHNGAFALRGFAFAAWQAQGCPSNPPLDPATPPLADVEAAGQQAVQYKQGLLPVTQCAPVHFCSTLLPVVDDPGTPPSEDKPLPCMGGHESTFPGLYTVMLPRKAWSEDSSQLVLHTAWFSRLVAIAMKIEGPPAQEGAPPQLRVSQAVCSLAVGAHGMPSPQEVLQGALKQAGVLAVAPPDTPGALSPTAVRRSSHSGYLSVTSHGWCPMGLVLQVHCPVAGSYLATAAVDWEGGCMHVKPHTALQNSHVQDLLAAEHALRLCTPPPDKAAAVAASRTPLQAATALARLSWKVLRVAPLYKPDIGFVEAILVLPPHDTPRPMNGYPLIVMPHGGPHGAYPTVAFHSVCLFALAGYAVLTVNYRGSTGFGERALAALPGDCGRMDVLDCIDAAAAAALLPPPQGYSWEEAAAAAAFHSASGACVDCGTPDRTAFLEACEAGGGIGPVDCGRISVIGGSHGGFLTAHLIGQFPFVFRSAVARNPVIDISQMVGVTDIPDWCWVETLGISGQDGGYDYSTFKTPGADTLAAMRACSPIEYVQHVTAAVLLTTGAKDRRVPCSQSVLYYHSLKAQGKTCRMQWYPEDCHPLSSASTDADALVHMLLWLQKYAAPKD